MEDLLREVLGEGERLIGKDALRYILSRIVHDLSITNPSMGNLEIPLDPLEIDLSSLEEEEKRILLYELAELLGALAGPSVKHDILRRFNDQDLTTA